MEKDRTITAIEEEYIGYATNVITSFIYGIDDELELDNLLDDVYKLQGFLQASTRLIEKRRKELRK